MLTISGTSSVIYLCKLAVTFWNTIDRCKFKMWTMRLKSNLLLQKYHYIIYKTYISLILKVKWKWMYIMIASIAVLYMYIVLNIAFDFCRFCVIIWSTANDLRLRRISIPYLIHYIIFLSYFLRKSQYFPFECWVITSLVWRSPWLGIEPGTSRTRSQHSTTMVVEEAVQ